MTDVDSSAVAAIEYDADRHELHVRFRGGRTYTYLGVPPTEHRRLVEAASVGAHLNRHIKPRYRVTRRAALRLVRD